YEKQLFYKRQQVEDNLKRIGKIDLPEIPPVLGAEENKWYRNKLEYTFSSKRFIPESEFRNFQNQSDISLSEPGAPVAFPFGEGRDGAGAAGFHAKGLFDKVVEIERCWLQQEPSNAIRKAVSEFARKNNYSFYDYKL